MKYLIHLFVIYLEKIALRGFADLTVLLNYGLFSTLSDDLTDMENNTVTKDLANKEEHDILEGTILIIYPKLPTFKQPRYKLVQFLTYKSHWT